MLSATFQVADGDIYGVTAARLAANAEMPARIADPADPESEIANPDLFPTDQAYFETRAKQLLANMVRSWNDQHKAPAPAPTPAPAPGVVAKVYEVTMRQAQLALLGAGLLDDVEAALDALPETTEAEIKFAKAARITWEKSSTVQRDNPLINFLAGQLGLTSEQIDELFALAATL